MIALIGPTASKKSEVAWQLAKTGKYLIINADSRQLYANFPVLSAMPECLENHVLYGILEAGQKISVYEWVQLVKKEIEQTKLISIIVGGTGLYFKVLQDGIVHLPEVSLDVRQAVEDLLPEQVLSILSVKDPEVLSRFQDMRRLRRALAVFLQEGRSILEYFSCRRVKAFDFEISIYSIMPKRVDLWKNIEGRLDKNFEAMVNEVKASSVIKSDMLGFDEIYEYIQHGGSVDEVKQKIFFKTRQYAKRQKTYIRNCLKVEKEFNNYLDTLNYLQSLGD